MPALCQQIYRAVLDGRVAIRHITSISQMEVAMQEARSTISGQIVTAWAFARLTPPEIEAQRRSFTCSECNEPAHFRSASRNGHGACFAARPHADDCGLAVRGDGPWGPDGDDLVARWQADQHKIRLTLATDADEAAVGGDGSAHAQRGGGRHAGNGDPVGTISNRGPQRLLNLLATSQVFRTSPVEILLPGGTSMPANQFFVTFENANPDQHSMEYRGFWGIPVATSIWTRDGSRYLNTVRGRDGSKLALNIGEALFAQVMHRFRLERVSDLVGMYVLAFGEAYVTTGQQFTLYITNPAHMAVIDPATLGPVPR